jgi:hypothetical protein
MPVNEGNTVSDPPVFPIERTKLCMDVRAHETKIPDSTQFREKCARKANDLYFPPTFMKNYHMYIHECNEKHPKSSREIESYSVL